AQLIRQADIGSGILHFQRNGNPESYGRLRYLRQLLREAGCISPRVTEIARRLVYFDCTGDGVITSLIEQTPDPNSRIILTDDVDAFGLRRLQLDWRLNERDRRSIRVIAIEAAKEMARLDKARVQLAPYMLDPNLDMDVGPHAHHMGTTRMSAD